MKVGPPIRSSEALAVVRQGRVETLFLSLKLSSTNSARGQQATLTDTSQVFVLTVRNREANQAPPGPLPVIGRQAEISSKRPLQATRHA
jgi:hypothetical protein